MISLFKITAQSVLSFSVPDKHYFRNAS